ncbi:MAG: aldo/keto reductase [Oscillospiraceae bacterium]|jgi:predicted aldo/keto reductase-like oxidoreductase|nr:aldo/keto reductase [Oscillospiraceae bacterium]
MANSVQTDKIGKLGFGYMRLPRIDGKVDYTELNKMADTFLESGGTYFDAAYVYDSAEVALCESVVKRHPRESFQIATKLPVGMVNSERPVEHFLETSLERLGTDYIDFYLLHGINAGGSKQAEENGAWDFLAKMKKEGKIRHIGFSFHGSPEDLDEVLTKHPETEFAMLQLNYWDWDRPKVNARHQYEIARKYNIPVVAMEPLFGGKLASADSPIAELMRGHNPDVSIASWALRFLAQQEGLFVTLSGMSTYEQVADNIKTFKDLKPLSKDESDVIDKAIEILKSVPRIECTGCDYCKDCPENIPIASLINLYNDHLVHKTITNLGGSYNWITGGRGKAKNCTSCAVCENICPQDLEITDTLAKVSKLFD